MPTYERRAVVKYAGLAVAAGGVLSTSATAEKGGSDGPRSWSSLRGNAGNTGYVPGGSGPDESAAVVWTYDHEGPVAVDDGSVFLIVDGAVHALDAEDGELVGETDDVGAAGAPAIVDDTIYVGGDHLTAIDVGSGEVDWQVDLEHEDAVPSPTVVDETVFVAAGGTLHAVDAADGDGAWQFEPDEPLIEQSVAVGDGAVFTTDGAALYASEIGDGSDRWANANGEFGGEPIVATDRSVSIRDEDADEVAVYDPETGDRNWARAGAVPGLATSDHVYTLTGDAVVGYNRATGDELWRPSVDAETFGLPVGAGPTVYVGISGSDAGTGVAAFDVVADELTWMVETEAQPEHLAFADGTIYASDGGLVAIRSGSDGDGTDDEAAGDDGTGEGNETDEEVPANDTDGEDEVLNGDGESGDGMPGFTAGAGVAGGVLTLEWLRRKRIITDEE